MRADTDKKKYVLIGVKEKKMVTCCFASHVRALHTPGVPGGLTTMSLSTQSSCGSSMLLPGTEGAGTAPTTMDPTKGGEASNGNGWRTLREGSAVPCDAETEDGGTAPTMDPKEGGEAAAAAAARMRDAILRCASEVEETTVMADTSGILAEKTGEGAEASACDPEVAAFGNAADDAGLHFARKFADNIDSRSAKVVVCSWAVFVILVASGTSSPGAG